MNYDAVRAGILAAHSHLNRYAELERRHAEALAVVRQIEAEMGKLISDATGAFKVAFQVELKRHMRSKLTAVAVTRTSGKAKPRVA